MAKRAVRWAEAVDVEQTTRQWAAPGTRAHGRPKPAAGPRFWSPTTGSTVVVRYCGGKPTEGAALPCCARPLCGSCGVPRRCPRCKAPVPTSDGAIAAALERAASDCASAARRLGVAYARGELGLAQDERRAAQLYKAAAGAGDAAAQHNLGLMYMSGGKAPKALKWFRAAAAQDHAPSLYNLATARVRRDGRAARRRRGIGALPARVSARLGRRGLLGRSGGRRRTRCVAALSRSRRGGGTGSPRGAEGAALLRGGRIRRRCVAGAEAARAFRRGAQSTMWSGARCRARASRSS